MCSIFGAITACVIYKQLRDKIGLYISEKMKYIFLGNYFVLGALFAATIHPFDVPGDWKDVFIPLLNVNYSPYEYGLPISEIFILVMFFIYRYCQLEDTDVQQ